jgi:hypothetical protein
LALAWLVLTKSFAPAVATSSLREDSAGAPNESDAVSTMTRFMKHPIPLALVVGGVAGWAAASGPFGKAILKADPIAAPSANGDEAATPPERLLALAEAESTAAESAPTVAEPKSATATAQADRKPNILVIFVDDVGVANISAYTHGLVGYQTPNIDRLAKEGMMFTDYYAENSCTAGRSTFITGQA